MKAKTLGGSSVMVVVVVTRVMTLLALLFSVLIIIIINTFLLQYLNTGEAAGSHQPRCLNNEEVHNSSSSRVCQAERRPSLDDHF